jgi:hypothetical protein
MSKFDTIPVPISNSDTRHIVRVRVVRERKRIVNRQADRQTDRQTDKQNDINVKARDP